MNAYFRAQRGTCEPAVAVERCLTTLVLRLLPLRGNWCLFETIGLSGSKKLKLLVLSNIVRARWREFNWSPRQERGRWDTVGLYVRLEISDQSKAVKIRTDFVQAVLYF